MSSNTHQVSALLQRVAAGDDAARDALVPLIYDDLRQVAGGLFRNERPDHSLDPTEVVHEALMRLDQQQVPALDRQHFIRIAARVMRQVLVDHARARGAEKRGQRAAITLPDVPSEERPPLDVLMLDDALTRLGALKATFVELIELRYFAGLTVVDAGKVLGISRSEADRQWRTVRAWLASELQPGTSS